MSEARVPWNRLYPAHVVLVVCALFPGLINTVALAMLAPRIASDLGTSATLLAAVPLAADAALAFGSILAAELSRRVDGRKLFLVLLWLSWPTALGSALAPNVRTFVATLLVHALAAGMLLILALPPLVTTFGARRLAPTALILVSSLFGSVTLGPLVGGLVDAPVAWRYAFLGDALVALVALALAQRTIAPRPAPVPAPPVDWAALGIAAAATLLVFGGVFRLESSAWRNATATVPFALGVAGYAALVVVEYARANPLVPVRLLLGSLALAGAAATVIGNWAYAATMDATVVALTRLAGTPLRDAGLALWPGLVASLVGGAIFAAFVRTRWVVVLGPVGLACSAAAGALAFAHPIDLGLAHAIALLAALGGALTIVPGLFLIALSFERAMVGRGIALLNLLRLTGAFAAGPSLAHLLSRLPVRAALPRLELTVVVVAALGVVAIALILRLAHVPVRDPDLAAFDAGHPALVSPRLAPRRTSRRPREDAVRETEGPLSPPD